MRPSTWRVHAGRPYPSQENPGALLGAVMGEMARVGRDKVTFLLSRDMATFGMWLEQLIAESTGKEGTGLLPVTGEPAGTPLVYGSDRLFVHIYMKGRSDARLEEAVRMLQTASLPLVFIEVAGACAIAPGILPVGSGDRDSRRHTRYKPL